MKLGYRPIGSFRILMCIGAALSLQLCSCSEKVWSDPRSYFGEYVFMPINTSPGKFANFLVLRADQSAVEIRVDEKTGKVQDNQENWHLSYTTGLNVVIGDFSHPVEHTRSSIRLVINGDLGEYYEKLR
jgi:hypothetical protein